MVFAVAPISGRLSAHIPVRLLMGSGLALTGIGVALLTRVDVDSDWTVLVAGFVVAGAGAGLVNPALASSAIGTVPREKAGVGSGVNNTARQVGIAAGIAALGAIFQSRVQDVLGTQLAQNAPELGARRQQIVDSAVGGDVAGALQSLPPGLRPTVAQAFRIAFVEGFDRILWVGAGVALVGSLLAFVLVRQKDFETAPDVDPSR